uniref:hypothetical protein n=1 Tax=Microbulbifer agarilyticus TaxID=260552 RepID=UPI0002558686|nr:hypothetical protein [Microbulbifer agarilyticus]
MKKLGIVFIIGVALGVLVAYFPFSYVHKTNEYSSMLTERGMTMVAIADLLSEAKRKPNITTDEIFEEYVCEEYLRQREIVDGKINWANMTTESRTKNLAIQYAISWTKQAEAYNPDLIESCTREALTR